MFNLFDEYDRLNVFVTIAITIVICYFISSYKSCEVTSRELENVHMQACFDKGEGWVWVPHPSYGLSRCVRG